MEGPAYYKGKDRIPSTGEKQKIICDYLDHGEINCYEAGAIYTMVKYIDRAGKKPFVSHKRDLFKAADFYHMIVTSKWLNETVDRETLSKWYEEMEQEEREMRNNADTRDSGRDSEYCAE